MILATTDIIRGSHNYGDSLDTDNINVAIDFMQNNDMNNLTCNIKLEGNHVLLTSLEEGNTDTGFIICDNNNDATVIYETLISMNIHNV